MKRFSLPLLAIAAAAIVTAAGAGRAAAQVASPWPSSFPQPTATATRAIAGTITASQPFSAQLQTADGKALTLTLRHGTTILDPKLYGLAVGQRVYVIGATQGDGSVLASEIDVMPALMTQSMLPPPRTVPAAAPAAAPANAAPR